MIFRGLRQRVAQTALIAATSPPVDARGFPLPSVEIGEHKFPKINGAGKKLSIIYNYFQKSSTVFKSLDSLAAQDWGQCQANDIEIILVDDGSTDESIADKLPPHVVYVWQRRNGYGISRAKNTGAKLSKGEILVFLDPDIMVSPGYIDAIVSSHRQFGPRTVLSGYIHDYHYVGCPDPRIEFGVWERPRRMTRRFYQLAGGNMAISRSLFSETHGFDEDLIYGGVEDLLFGYHLSRLSDATIAFLPEMEGRHIPHPPSPAHADPGSSWEVVKRKWPEFHDEYMIKGIR